MIAKLIKLLTVKKLADKMFNLFLLLLILGSIVLVILFVIKMVIGERFTIIDLVAPPLEKVSTNQYAWGCPINGYKCEPTMIYIVKLQGQGAQKYMKYVKYKLINSDNDVLYSGLYNKLEGLKVGSYITFDNGQEYIIQSLDANNDQPKDCVAIRKDPADNDRGAVELIA